MLAWISGGGRGLIFEIRPALVAWEGLVSLALLGFGMGGLRALGKRRQPVGLAMCAGVAVWLVVGGWLNLLGWARRPVLVGLLLVGFVIFVTEIARREVRELFAEGFRALVPGSVAGRVAGGIVGGFFLLCFAVHLASFTWNKFDDVQAYMPFAAKASALGGLQAEPFSERRVTSGVGGAVFLDATMLAGGGMEGMDFLEGGFGLVALLLCVGAAGRRFGLSRGQGVAVLFAVAVFTLGRVNLTSVNLSAAMFLAVLVGMMDGAGSVWNEVWIGVLLGAAFTLKSSNIPFCGLLLGVAAVGAVVKRRNWRPLLGVAVAGLVSVAVMLPWAIKHWADEGTALFPSLGRGDHLSAYGFPAISQTAAVGISLLAAIPGFAFPAIAGVLAFVLLRRLPRVPMGPILATFAAAAVSAPLFSVSIAAEDIQRFMLPMEVVCALIFLMVVLAALRERPRGRWVWAAGAFFVVWAAASVNTGIAQFFYRDPGDIVLLAGGTRNLLQVYEVVLRPADLAAETAKVRRAQASVPEGATLLEGIEAAYGFDWRRNRVLIADYPGMASLPPGVPIDGGAEDVRRYLLSQGVGYAMIDRELYKAGDYFEFRRNPRERVAWREMLRVLHPLEVHGYTRMEYRVSNRTRELLAEIAVGRRVVYDDGRLEVFSLDGER